MENKTYSHLSLQQVAECAAVVALAIREEEGTMLHLITISLARKENSLHHIAHINEGDFLRLIAYCKVHMLLDALCHQEVVTFARAIDTRWTQDDPGHIGLLLQPTLGGQLALAISRIRLGCIILRNSGIRSLFLDSAKDAQRADENQPARHHPRLAQGGDEVLCAFGVRAEKTFALQRLRGASCVDNIIPAFTIHRGFQFHELLDKGFTRTQVQLSKVCARV